MATRAADNLRGILDVLVTINSTKTMHRLLEADIGHKVIL